MPIIFILIILLVLWIHYEKQKSTKQSLSRSENFWEQEHKSNLTRKQDISNLEYITVPLEQLPFACSTADTQLQYLEEQVKQIAQLKILNLTGITNTELKEKYGRANLDVLSEYDNNFILFVRALHNWGSYLYKANQKECAQLIFEYAISCGSDIKSSYLLLASIYKENKNTEGIQSLLQQSYSLHSLLKQSIQQELSKLLQN